MGRSRRGQGAGAGSSPSKADKAKVLGLIKVWLGSGALVVVKRQDDRRKTKDFVEVAAED